MGVLRPAAVGAALCGVLYGGLERAGWAQVVRIPFTTPSTATMLHFFDRQVNIDNDAFIERWRGAERPVNAPGLLITDSNYSFMRIGGAEVKGDRVFRSFATHGMREGMRRMIAGENIQLGFDVKMADENPWLKNIGLELLAKVNAFDSSVMYLAQSFLYHGTSSRRTCTTTRSGFSIQLANSKPWRFVNPRHTPRVRPFRGDNPGVFYSDLCFLENGTIPFLEVLVEPGDMIFFPEHWWHEVHPVERTGFGMTVAALTDMIVNKRAADAPENL
ncbi:hypothetical protein JL722_15092 [Aureococcus anophagefferens]|nr:hypothetical protein JL722_15092 [Aureococcus anophagefferens]